jgi:hypothetical protein
MQSIFFAEVKKQAQKVLNLVATHDKLSDTIEIISPHFPKMQD